MSQHIEPSSHDIGESLPVADLQSYHIEGIARAAVEQGLNGDFAVSVVSEITDNLWMGGCLSGIRLPDRVDFVMSLYLGERYVLGPRTARVEDPFYDSSDEITPKLEQRLEGMAKMVNAFRCSGLTLVHCQAGLNRSGIVCALALIREGMEPREAIDLLRAKRCSAVLCNLTFEQWLLTRSPGPLS